MAAGGWEMQFDIAAERAGRTPGFTQLVWLPHWLQRTDERLEQLAEDLRRSEGSAGEIEVVQTSLEDLKMIVSDALERAAAAGRSAADEAVSMVRESNRRIYLIHDRRDAAAVEPLAEHFREQGFDLLLPVEEQDHALLRERHFTNLRSCDAALIFYGAVNEQWVRMKQQDLKKAAGYGRTRAMIGAVYIGGEPTSGKERFRAADLTVIRQFGRFAPAAVGGFVQQLQQGVTESAG